MLYYIINNTMSRGNNESIDMKFLSEQILPGENSFLTLFDSEFFISINKYLSDKGTTLRNFLNENKKLIELEPKNFDKILKYCNGNENINDKLKDVLDKIKLSEFLKEGLARNGRLFSGMEKGNRKVLTKPDDKGNVWNPVEKGNIITINYLEKLTKSKGSYYEKQFYDLKIDDKKINKRFLENVKKADDIDYNLRKQYGFTFGEKEDLKDPDNDDKNRLNFIRRLGVIIYDLIMAEVGVRVIEKYSEEDKKKLSNLFKNFIDERSTIMAKIIKDKVFKKDKKVICLLQEVGKKIKNNLNGDQSKSESSKAEKKNASSFILSNNNVELELNEINIGDKDKYELECKKYTYDGKSLYFYSFHADTTGGHTKEFIEGYLNKHENVIIGLDSNLKKKEQLFEFMKIVKENNGEIAGFNLEDIVSDKFNRFDIFYDKLTKNATNGGIRSSCQSQWGKIHTNQNNYIDFIVYKGNDIKQILAIDGKTIDINDVIIINNENINIVGAGLVDNGVNEWGNKVLSATNPSDHLPRCSTFKFCNKEDIVVMSWNVAGPNFNWAEYYGDTTVKDINNMINDNTYTKISMARQGINTGSRNNKTDNAKTFWKELTGETTAGETTAGGTRKKKRKNKTKKTKKNKGKRSKLKTRKRRKKKGRTYKK